MTNEELEELTNWYRRVRQAQQIARLLAANQRVFLVATARGLTLYNPPPLPGRCVYDNHGRPLYRIIGASPDFRTA